MFSKSKIAVVSLAVWSMAAVCPASTILIDFGSNTTTTDALGRTWVNVGSTTDVSSSPHTLTDTTSVDSGYKLTVANPAGVTNAVGFNGANTNGTTAPTGNAQARGYPVSATNDSLYGNTVAFSSLTVEAVRLLLTNLQPNEVYDLYFFASRTGVSDNREAQYQVTGGNGANSAFLNAANNTGNVVSVTGVTPDTNQQIIIDIAKGPNNTNTANGFFYLGVLEINATPVPEPSTLLLVGLALALALLFGYGRAGLRTKEKAV